jgi:hypothetical protein
MLIEHAWDRIGCPVAEIDTPALLVDLEALQGNIRKKGGRCIICIMFASTVAAPVARKVTRGSGGQASCACFPAASLAHAGG